MNAATSGIKGKFKKYAIGLGIIFAAIAVFSVLKSTKPKQAAVEIKQKVWPVDVIAVRPGKVAPVQVLYGTIESNSMVTAAAPVSGVIDDVMVKEGEQVFEGQKLLQLAKADIELPYQLAKADVADTQAQLQLQDLAYAANRERLAHEKNVLDIKRKDLQRNKDLIKKELISKSALDNAREALVRQEFAVVGAELSVKENKTKVDQLSARLQKARVNLEQAEINRSRGIVVAPYSGRIAAVSVAKGDRVGVNAPLISYYAFDSLELRAKIPASQLKRIYMALEQHEKISASLSLDDKQFSLPFKRLAGKSSTSGVDAFFQIPSALKIMRPGDLLKVQLTGREIDNTFSLPYSAMYGSDRIYIVKDESLQSVAVTYVGDTVVNGEQWALVSGNVEPDTAVAVTHLPNAISGLKVVVTEAQ